MLCDSRTNSCLNRGSAAPRDGGRFLKTGCDRSQFLSWIMWIGCHLGMAEDHLVLSFAPGMPSGTSLPGIQGLLSISPDKSESNPGAIKAG